MKILSIIVGVAVGAVGGPLIVFALMLRIYEHASKKWDDAISIYILGAGAAALFGGALGGLAGLYLWQGRVRRGLLTFAGSMTGVATLTLLVTAAISLYINSQNLPSKGERDRWAARRGTLDPQFGLQLAHQLLDCHERIRLLTPEALAAGGCQSVQSLRVGAVGRGYDRSDNGWRWETVTSERGDKVVVRPDPLLQQPGPVFEFDESRLLVQRDSPDAPPFAADSSLPAAETYRQCLSASGVDGCRHLERQRRPESQSGGPDESYAIVLDGTDGRPVDVRLFVRGVNIEGRFALLVAGRGRRYMFLEASGWHVTGDPGSIVTSASPAPAACELDRLVPCEVDAQ